LRHNDIKQNAKGYAVIDIFRQNDKTKRAGDTILDILRDKDRKKEEKGEQF
jgi:hypothetical protein